MLRSSMAEERALRTRRTLNDALDGAFRLYEKQSVSWGDRPDDVPPCRSANGRKRARPSPGRTIQSILGDPNAHFHRKITKPRSPSRRSNARQRRLVDAAQRIIGTCVEANSPGAADIPLTIRLDSYFQDEHMATYRICLKKGKDKSISITEHDLPRVVNVSDLNDRLNACAEMCLSDLSYSLDCYVGRQEQVKKAEVIFHRIAMLLHVEKSDSTYFSYTTGYDKVQFSIEINDELIHADLLYASGLLPSSVDVSLQSTTRVSSDTTRSWKSMFRSSYLHYAMNRILVGIVEAGLHHLGDDVGEEESNGPLSPTF